MEERTVPTIQENLERIDRIQNLVYSSTTPENVKSLCPFTSNLPNASCIDSHRTAPEVKVIKDDLTIYMRLQGLFIYGSVSLLPYPLDPMTPPFPENDCSISLL